MERFRIHFDSWALQSELEQRLPELLPRLDTYETGRRALGAVVGVRRRAGLGADPLGRPRRHADVPRGRRRVSRRQARARLRPRDLRARRRPPRDRASGTRRSRGCSATTRERVEVLLYQFVHLTRGGEPSKVSKRAGNVVFLDDFLDEVGVDAARWYLVNRGPDQTIEIDLDLAAEKSQKNPVYYVQYAHARIAAILRNADGAEVGGAPPGPLAAGGEGADQAARPTSRDRARGGGAPRAAAVAGVRDQARRRLPPLLPRVPRARRPGAVVPPRPVPRDAAGDRPLPRPGRGRGSRADVTAGRARAGQVLCREATRRSPSCRKPKAPRQS